MLIDPIDDGTSEPTMSFVRSAVCVVAVIVPFLSGCGSKEATLPMVSGTVTFNGEPVEYGYISFFGSDPNLGPQAGEIKNGKFGFQARTGTMRVEIRATRPVPGTITRVEFIPARYNKESILTEEISEENRHFEFKLTD
jgi:hypothetical protein